MSRACRQCPSAPSERGSSCWRRKERKTSSHVETGHGLNRHRNQDPRRASHRTHVLPLTTDRSRPTCPHSLPEPQLPSVVTGSVLGTDSGPEARLQGFGTTYTTVETSTHPGPETKDSSKTPPTDPGWHVPGGRCLLWRLTRPSRQTLRTGPPGMCDPYKTTPETSDTRARPDASPHCSRPWGLSTRPCPTDDSPLSLLPDPPPSLRSTSDGAVRPSPCHRVRTDHRRPRSPPVDRTPSVPVDRTSSVRDGASESSYLRSDTPLLRYSPPSLRRRDYPRPPVSPYHLLAMVTGVTPYLPPPLTPPLPPPLRPPLTPSLRPSLPLPLTPLLTPSLRPSLPLPLTPPL